MKEKKLYTCEICHTDYANPKDAEACEGSHKLTKGKGSGLKVSNSRGKCVRMALR